MFTRLILLPLFLATITCVEAIERAYITPMEDSLWRMTVATRLHCEMEHEIPRFGKAIFARSAGRDLQLKLVSHQVFKKGINVEFLSESPDWRAVATKINMASLTTRNDVALLQIGSKAANYAYLELRDGYHPGFYFASNKDLSNRTIVMMSTVRFRDVEPEFEQCVNNLYFENFDDVRVTNVHFDSGDEFPRSEDEDGILSNMLDYMRVDKSIRQIVVSGHTDMTGGVCFNQVLSTRRADYVYDMLIASGIDPNMVLVDYIGEHKPRVKGSTKSALAANRRVSIELRH